MSNREKKSSQICLTTNTCKNIARLTALFVWLLLFFGNTFIVNDTAITYAKYSSSAFSVKQTESSEPLHNYPFGPLSIPEERESTSPEFFDTEDNQKKFIAFDFDFYTFSSQEVKDVHCVHSFHFRQSVKRCADIPLFILYHSWKDYLI